MKRDAKCEALEGCMGDALSVVEMLGGAGDINIPCGWRKSYPNTAEKHGQVENLRKMFL